MDPDYRRLVYTRYADDTLIGIIGSKAEATEIKAWLANYLKEQLGLELSTRKPSSPMPPKGFAFWAMTFAAGRETPPALSRQTGGSHQTHRRIPAKPPNPLQQNRSNSAKNTATSVDGAESNAANC